MDTPIVKLNPFEANLNKSFGHVDNPTECCLERNNEDRLLIFQD